MTSSAAPRSSELLEVPTQGLDPNVFRLRYTIFANNQYQNLRSGFPWPSGGKMPFFTEAGYALFHQ